MKGVPMPAKTEKQRRFLEGVKHGNIHRKGITPKDAARALGDEETPKGHPKHKKKK